jgi:hypothetical protein
MHKLYDTSVSIYPLRFVTCFRIGPHILPNNVFLKSLIHLLWETLHALKTKNKLCYLKTQFVSRRKHI